MVVHADGVPENNLNAQGSRLPLQQKKTGPEVYEGGFKPGSGGQSNLQQLADNSAQVKQFARLQGMADNYVAQQKLTGVLHPGSTTSTAKPAPVSLPSHSPIQFRRYQYDAGKEFVPPNTTSEIQGLANWLDVSGYVVQTREKGEIYVWKDGGDDRVGIDRDHVHICISDSGDTKGLWTAYPKGKDERSRVILKPRDLDRAKATYDHASAIEATGVYRPVVEACLEFYGFSAGAEGDEYEHRLNLWSTVSTLILKKIAEEKDAGDDRNAEGQFNDELGLIFSRLDKKQAFFILPFKEVTDQIREAVLARTLQDDDKTVAAVLKKIK